MRFVRRWSITLITAAVTATVLLVVVVIAFGDSNERRSAQSASRSPIAPGAVKPRTPQATNIGPEGVPLSGGVPLGAAHPPRAGSARGGIPCGSREQLRYHVHAHLTIFVNGKPRSVPLGIGIGAPVRMTPSARGPFASGGTCFSFLHTHAADGVIHIEAPAKIDFTLGQFFDVWRQRLDRRHLGSNRGRVIAYVNGKRYRRDPRTIVLAKHAQIQLELGGPRVKPAAITFPPGL